MSAFLGPIHYWLFHKIQIQQSIVEDIYTLGEEYGLSLREECDQKYGVLENKPLEEMITHDNIHGWLQERVSQVEYKYATAVTRILEKDPSSLTKIKTVLTNKGYELGQSLEESDKDLSHIFKVISDQLLDGMPCDHAIQLIDQNDTEVIWKRSVCVHEDYWNQVGGDIAIYYDLRDAWMEGLAKACGLVFNKVNPTTYALKKGA